MIFEEAAFIDPEVINVVAVPLMLVDGTVTLAISTPSGDDDNYYNAFLDIPSAENPGEKMFKTVKLGLACDPCVLAGKGAECKHKAHLLPPWKSAAGMEKGRLIQKGMPELFQQENMGMIINNTQYYFSAKLVEALRQRHSFKFTTLPNIVYIGIDPSGGGDRSNYSMASVVRHQGLHHIVGLDHTPSADYEEINTMVYTHLRRLRSKPEFQHCLFVVFFESNMSWIETSRMRPLLEHPSLQPVHLHSKDPKEQGRVGIITTNMNKEAYVHTLLDMMVSNTLDYSADLFTQEKDGPESIRAQLEAQMRNFRKCRKPAKFPEFNQPKVAMSGKSSTMKDDLLMSLMFALYFPTELLADSQFVARATSLGFQPT